MKTKDLVTKYLPRFQRPDLNKTHIMEAVGDLADELIKEINQEFKTVSAFTEKDKRTAMWKLNDKANRVMEAIEKQVGHKLVKKDWMRWLAKINPEEEEA